MQNPTKIKKIKKKGLTPHHLKKQIFLSNLTTLFTQRDLSKICRISTLIP